MRILFVEDDEALAPVVANALSQQHYVLDLALDGEQGWDYACTFTYDLMLLDVSLPKLDGISLCRKLREAGHQNPILLLTAKDDSADKVRGLDAGADDYVVKPCTIEELLARIRALLRRKTAPGATILAWGELCLNPSSCEVTYQGTFIPLTPKEYSLLELFLRHPRHVFSRSAILEHLWSFSDPPSEDTVRAHIKGLRRKLKSVGAQEAVETVYGIGYRLQLPPQNTPSPSKQQQTQTAVNALWEQFKPQIWERVAALDRFFQALQDGTFTPQLRFDAEQQAHKLVGSLGVFGYPKGSDVARDIEQLLIAIGNEPLELASDYTHHPLTPRLIAAIHQLHETLQNSPEAEWWQEDNPELLDAPGSSDADLDPAQIQQNMTEPPQRQNPVLLVVDDDAELVQRLQACSLSWDLQVEVALDPIQARSLIAGTPPDAIVLDLNFPDLPDGGLELLEELKLQYPHIPVLVFTVRDGFDDRVTVARLGGRAFFSKPIPPHQVLEAVQDILQRNRTAARPRVLAVDDDPLLLKVIRRFLEPWGIELRTLDDPRQFWETLEATVPDLLILDVQMPHVSGIELCRVVRNDSTWNGVPILFLSADRDGDTIHQLYQVGADDYIHKPVTEPELVTRIFNRLERIQLLRTIAETDPLTGVANRSQSTKELHRYLRLANMHQQPLCLAILDLDDFKQINDRMGHDMGDRILQRLGMILRQKFRSDDVVSRWGGEEFVIGMYGMTQQDGVRRLAEVLQAIRSEVFLVTGHSPFQVTCSAGVVEYPRHGKDLPSLYRAADHALEQAKAIGCDRIWLASDPVMC
jgi:diguanylate cyclase (GGDEF)-like protein